MGRKIAYNPEMAELGELVARYMGNRTIIRARYAALAEKEIADQRVELQRRMVTDFPDAGPSEFANSIGLSRSTVIRWLEEYAERHLNVQTDAAEAPTGHATYGVEDGTAYVIHDGTRVYLLTGDTFGWGDSKAEADQPGNLTTAPEWMTEDLMREVIEQTGATLLYAPWDVRARAAAKKEKSA